MKRMAYRGGVREEVVADGVGQAAREASDQQRRRGGVAVTLKNILIKP